MPKSRRREEIALKKAHKKLANYSSGSGESTYAVRLAWRRKNTNGLPKPLFFT